jgi:hypothetical protein
MQILINPGSGPVQNGSKEQSEANIKQFITDLGIGCDYEFLQIEEDGRHTYRICNQSQSHEIQMPALPLENVRYMAEYGQKIFNFKRLYVDNSSWTWWYALGLCFNNDDKEE